MSIMDYKIPASFPRVLRVHYKSTTFSHPRSGNTVGGQSRRLSGSSEGRPKFGRRPDMDRIFRGIMKYRRTNRTKMVEQFVQVKNRPEPKALFFTCMDSRMLPARFTDSNVGDMFIVRNAGNLIPRSQHSPDECTSCEPAALELGCVHNGIRHVIVCGHSDCKAMNSLHLLLRDAEYGSAVNRRKSPLRAWLCSHAMSSLEKYRQLEAAGLGAPLVFQAETRLRRIRAYIDPDDKLSVTDKLSQVNTLQQIQNIASYDFLKRRLEAYDLHVHALWFDIYTGDIHYFSRQSEWFVDINEKNVDRLVEEVSKYYS